MFDELRLFDFDGTLFRSPDEPDWWQQTKMGSFHSHPWSLSPPVVPAIPDLFWWNTDLLPIALGSIANPAVLTVLCTGRDDQVFGSRVRELLSQQDLLFTRIYCNPGMDTKSWKIGMLEDWLRLYPDIPCVQIWDDREGHLQDLAQAVSPPQVVIPHLVKLEPMPTISVQRIVEKFLAQSDLT